MKIYNIRKVLGDNVRYYRYKLGYTQEELAEKTDISPRYISDIENGRGNVSLDSLEILGQGLKVEPYILLKPHNHRTLPKRVNMN